MDKKELTAMEEMLRPRCEVRASAELKDRVMAEARRRTAARRIRLWPWVAACAAVVAVIVVSMPGNREDTAQDTPRNTERSVTAAGGHVSTNTETGGETAVITATETDCPDVTGTEKPQRESSGKAAEVAGKRPAGVMRQAEEKPEAAQETAGHDAATAAADTMTAMADATDGMDVNTYGAATAAPDDKPKAEPRVLTEADLPTTRPENLKYTPEEIALLKKNADEAYRAWMRLELEIIKITQERTAQMMEEIK